MVPGSQGLNIEPIGYFEGDAEERYSVGRQPGIVKGNCGKIILNPGLEQAMEDLEGFDRIWVIYRFHRNTHWKPKVLPPRGEKKRGVFATRSPHRPNFLGLSCLEVKKIEGLTIEIEGHDLLDGTPIFDIKPYIVYADSFPHAKQGWLDKLQEKCYTLTWSALARAKADFLNCIEENIRPRLVVNPFPSKNNRIRPLENDRYEIAYKSWRISFCVAEETVHILDIFSGYSADTKESPWNDLHIHTEFNERFN